MKHFIGFAVAFLLASCGSAPSYDEASISATTRLPNKSNQYPRWPETSVTPGTTCTRADSTRYPERIKYCDRDVEPQLKVQIFAFYDHRLGFHTQSLPRGQFKIDHLIPLCMGGGNEQANLWPQHETIYTLTDPIEPFLCGLLAQGRMKQTEAMKIIREVKQAPETTDATMALMQRRFGRSVH